MRTRAGRLAAMGIGLWASLALPGAAAAANAVSMPELLPHHVTYKLRLDSSRPSSQVEHMAGEIDYRITGNSCSGYATKTRQSSEISAGDGVNRQEIESSAWEDGNSRSYRFSSISTGSDIPRKEIEAKVARDDAGGLQVNVTRPDVRSFDLGGKVFLPTEHMRRTLAAGLAGESHFAAKVYDGASDPSKVYDTLAVIGEARQAAPASGTTTPAIRGLTEMAAQALEGQSFRPVVISYFDSGEQDGPPAYVMSFSLYENGVLGDLRIDYGRFALVGAMSRFEPLGSVADCTATPSGSAPSTKE